MVIRRLEKEKENACEETRNQIETLHEENKQLSKMVAIYSRDMQQQLEALERPSKCKQGDHKLSFAKAKKVIFRSSSGEPKKQCVKTQEVQNTKPTTPVVETKSVLKK